MKSTSKSLVKAGKKSNGFEHLLSAADLSIEQIHFLLKVAKLFSAQITAGNPIPLLKGLTVVNLFFENSTRTRTSFELAVRKLEGSTLNFATTSSSTQKGETLIDTARNIKAMGPHCIVVRHASAGSPLILSKAVNIPIINAGDGLHEHPTQALLDAFTIQQKLGDKHGSIRGKRIVIVGDIAHSRVARSNIHILTKLGASVAVCAPPTLMPPQPTALGVGFSYHLEELLPEADVIIALRIQLERQNRMQIPSTAEYSQIWGMSKERAKLLKKGAIILHPGPVNRGVEIDPEVAEGPNSVIMDQVTNGIVVRMAVLAALCNLKGLSQWLESLTLKGASRV